MILEEGPRELLHLDSDLHVHDADGNHHPQGQSPDRRRDHRLQLRVIISVQLHILLYVQKRLRANNWTYPLSFRSFYSASRPDPEAEPDCRRSRKCLAFFGSGPRAFARLDLSPTRT